MERGLKIPQSERTKTTNSLLVSLMKQLEKDKKSLKLGPDDHLHLEGFALNVFAKADKQDRAGHADLNTAKTFYAASIFFEILNQFGEPQTDLEQKQKYAAWKAADIRKALKEGRKPVPGPPGGEKDLSVPSSAISGEYDLEPKQTQSDFGPAADADYPPAPRSDSPFRPATETEYPLPPRSDSVVRPSFESDSLPQMYDKTNFQSSANIPSPPPSNIPSSSSYPSDGYPSHNFQQPPTNGSENSYSQLYHQQAYQPESQQHLPQQYPSHDATTYSYPNFQSYPSFADSSLPAAPSHYPSYYQGSDTSSYSNVSYSTSSSPNVAKYSSSTQYESSGRNGSVSEPMPASPQTFHYDSNYQPPPEKISEAHKAARFAVGALAFDEVSVAVEHLKKALELLTNQSAGH